MTSHNRVAMTTSGDKLNYPSQKIVTVCDKCLTESCWQGRMMCAEKQTAFSLRHIRPDVALRALAGAITATEAEIAQMMPSEIELAAERSSADTR